MTSTDTPSSTDTAAAPAPTVDWQATLSADTDVASAPSTAAGTLPDMPYVVGRLVLKGRPSTVILELPEPYRLVSKAALGHNVTIFTECGKKINTCRQHSLKARPMDDRRIEVELADGDGTTISGLGWADNGFGGQLETAWVPYDVPVVEVVIFAGRFKVGGCDPANNAVDPY